VEFVSSLIILRPLSSFRAVGLSTWFPICPSMPTSPLRFFLALDWFRMYFPRVAARVPGRSFVVTSGCRVFFCLTRLYCPRAKTSVRARVLIGGQTFWSPLLLRLPENNLACKMHMLINLCVRYRPICSVSSSVLAFNELQPMFWCGCSIPTIPFLCKACLIAVSESSVSLSPENRVALNLLPSSSLRLPGAPASSPGSAMYVSYVSRGAALGLCSGNFCFRARQNPPRGCFSPFFIFFKRSVRLVCFSVPPTVIAFFLLLLVQLSFHAIISLPLTRVIDTTPLKCLGPVPIFNPIIPYPPLSSLRFFLSLSSFQLAC